MRPRDPQEQTSLLATPLFPARATGRWPASPAARQRARGRRPQEAPQFFLARWLRHPRLQRVDPEASRKLAAGSWLAFHAHGYRDVRDVAFHGSDHVAGKESANLVV